MLNLIILPVDSRHCDTRACTHRTKCEKRISQKMCDTRQLVLPREQNEYVDSGKKKLERETSNGMKKCVTSSGLWTKRWCEMNGHQQQQHNDRCFLNESKMRNETNKPVNTLKRVNNQNYLFKSHEIIMRVSRQTTTSTREREKKSSNLMSTQHDFILSFRFDFLFIWKQHRLASIASTLSAE